MSGRKTTRNIPGNLYVKCPWCMRRISIEEVSEYTFSKCKNREMKRDFLKLTDVRAWSKTKKYYFICPECNQWASGSQYEVCSADAKYRNLGKEPVITIKQD
ncbi:MAG: hypothetical protein IJ593_04820 [Lachnospiraceae bacterium]|nr:hypothetical protein [Lachnospiraceae bacterium]